MWTGFTLLFQRAFSCPWGPLGCQSTGKTRLPVLRLKGESVSPLNGFFLFLHHVRQLLEDGAQLDDGGLDVLHGVCPALDVRILQRRECNERPELPRVGPASSGLSFAIPPTAHSKHLLVTTQENGSNSSPPQSVGTCSSMSCSCWLVRESIMSMATSPEARDSAPKTTAPPPGGKREDMALLSS